MMHRQVGRAGLRPRAARPAVAPGRLDRLLGMLVVVGHAPGTQLPLAWLRLVWSCLLRAVGYLIGKAPGRSRDELLAPRLLRRPSRPDPADARSGLAAIDPAPGAGDVVRSLRPPWWSASGSPARR